MHIASGRMLSSVPAIYTTPSTRFVCPRNEVSYPPERNHRHDPAVFLNAARWQSMTPIAVLGVVGNPSEQVRSSARSRLAEHIHIRPVPTTHTSRCGEKAHTMAKSVLRKRKPSTKSDESSRTAGTLTSVRPCHTHAHPELQHSHPDTHLVPQQQEENGLSGPLRALVVSAGGVPGRCF